LVMTMAFVIKDRWGRSPYWYAAFQGPDGIRIRKSTKATNRQKALGIAMEWERAARQARAGVLVEAQARKVLNEIAGIMGGEPLKFFSVRKWLEGWLANKEGSKAGATHARYRGIAQRFLESLGKRADSNLAAVQPSDVAAFRESERKNGKSPQTCNFAVHVIGGAFNAAKRLGYIDVNPCHALEPMRQSRPERDRFAPNQIAAIIAAAEGDWKGAILVGYYAGLRLQDIASLTWQNVDVEKRLLRFLPRKTAGLGRELVVPMHPELETYLLSLEAPDDASPAVFPELHGRDTSSLSKSFSRIMEAAKIDNRQVRSARGQGRSVRALSFHSLRHSFNSALADGGVMTEIRQELAGQSSEEVNRQYTHREISRLRSAVNVIPRLPSI